MKYLIDTSICINVLRKRFNSHELLLKIADNDCYISEITLFELKVGDAIGRKKEKGYKNQSLEKFLNLLQVIPITNVVEAAAEEKARLQLAGTPLDDDFDLLIGETSVIYGMTMVTDNTRHFKNIEHIHLENWVKRS